MDEFKNVVQQFMRKPGFIPTPPDASSKVLTKEDEKISELLSKIKHTLMLIEKYLHTDFQRCKIEFFTLEYLYHQIPDSMKTKELIEKILHAGKAIADKEKALLTSHFELKKAKDLTALEEVKKDKAEFASLERTFRYQPRESEKAINTPVPKDTKEGLYQKGLQLMQEHKHEEAHACFQKVLEISPNHVAARIRIMQLQKLKDGEHNGNHPG
ncbi:tetratricopeptide repeat protein [Candidatus Woesearchaeota archaeon]|nr:MAG: tetratricopeptide repeat protein [Candidatus Woesearchaeota archaeon]